MQHVFFRTLFGAAPCPKADRWLCGTSRPPGIALARNVALNTKINWWNVLHEMCTYPNEILFQIQSQAEHAKCQSCRKDTILRNHVNMIQPVPLRNRCWKPSEPLPKCQCTMLTRLLTQRLRHCTFFLRGAYVDSPYAIGLRKLTWLRVSLTQASYDTSPSTQINRGFGRCSSAWTIYCASTLPWLPRHKAYPAKRVCASSSSHHLLKTAVGSWKRPFRGRWDPFTNWDPPWGKWGKRPNQLPRQSTNSPKNA